MTNKGKNNKSFFLENLDTDESIVQRFDSHTTNLKQKLDAARYVFLKIHPQEGLLDYLKHYEEDEELCLHFTRIQEYFPKFAEALCESRLTATAYVGYLNEALRSIEIECYPKSFGGYVRFSDNNKLDKIAVRIREEERKSKADAVLQRNADTVLHIAIAEHLLSSYHFKTMRDTGEVYVYRNGLYAKAGEAVIKEESKKLLEEKFTTHQVNEIINYIRYSTFVDRKEVNKDKQILNLKNGLLDIRTCELKPHSPGFFSTIRIPLKYDPKVDCPRIRQFFSEVVNEEAVAILAEIFGFVLYPEYFIHKLLLFVGSGRNGKSTTLKLLTRFIGLENTASVLIYTLESNRFAAAILFGKLALINADLPDKTLKSTGMLKMISGGDYIPAEIKFGGSFEFQNRAKILISCNKVPVTYDTTDAFFSRWIILNFPNQFLNDDANPNLLDELTTEEELSGLLNLALNGLNRLLENGCFSYDKSIEDIAAEYRTLSDPIYGFVADCCALDYDATTEKDKLYEAYVQYSHSINRPPATQNMFSRILPTVVTVIEVRPANASNKRPRAWKGIKVMKRYDHDVPDVPIYSPLKEHEEIGKGSSGKEVGKNGGHVGRDGQNTLLMFDEEVQYQEAQALEAKERLGAERLRVDVDSKDIEEKKKQEQEQEADNEETFLGAYSNIERMDVSTFEKCHACGIKRQCYFKAQWDTETVYLCHDCGDRIIKNLKMKVGEEVRGTKVVKLGVGEVKSQIDADVEVLKVGGK